MRNRPASILPHRRPLLLAGCGDVGLRLLAHYSGPDAVQRRGLRIVATCRRKEQAAQIRALGATPLQGDLNDPRFLRRLSALCSAGLIWMAPPPASGQTDPGSRRMLHALGARRARKHFAGAMFRPGAAFHRHVQTSELSAGVSVVYVSTTGVYGDRGGQWTDESTPAKPANARAIRRVDAENAWRGRRLEPGRKPVRWLSLLKAVAVLRAPGIYAAQRLPLERLHAGTPAIEHSDDSWSNHIHADDLARLAWRAIFRQTGRRVFNTVDDQPMRMGDYFDKVADHFGLPRPQRLPRATVKGMVSPMMWSFMAESRQLRNRRLAELGVKLRYPTVQDCLNTISTGQH